MNLTQIAALRLSSLAIVALVLGLQDPTPEPAAPTPPAESSGPATPGGLLERYGDDCWTGEAPPDVDMPGHVVWQHSDGRTVYSARLVGPALDTLFGAGNLPGHAIAFCR